MQVLKVVVTFVLISKHSKWIVKLMTLVNYQRINLNPEQVSKLASFLRQLASIYVVLRLPKGTAHSCTTAQLLIRPDLFINQPWTTNWS